MIELAYSIAKAAHEGQFDKGGNPYILHPLCVSKAVSSEVEKAVALLHDVVEDTDVTLDYLRSQGVSKDVIDAVDAITKRSNELYEDYLKRVCDNKVACSVKIADMEHNSDLSRIPKPSEKDLKRVIKYQKALMLLRNN